MKPTFYAFVFGAALLGLGCSSSTDGTQTAQNPPPKTSEPAATTTTGTADNTPDTDNDSGPSADSIPANFKNDAYHYYGLSRTEPINYVISQAGIETTGTGAESVKFAGMDKNGKARFSIVRTGQLAQLPNQDVWLDDKAITVASASPGTLDGHPIELPAKLSPGVTWKTDYKMSLSSGTYEDHSTYRVTGPAKVKTKAGTFDAILIESTGDDVENNVKVKVTTKAWYVKDRGAVRTVISSTAPNSKSQTITFEAVPDPSK